MGCGGSKTEQIEPNQPSQKKEEEGGKKEGEGGKKEGEGKKSEISYKSILDQFKAGKDGIEIDEYETSTGKPVSLVLIGHASYAFVHDTVIIYTDPYSEVGNFDKFPKADFILLTHEHPDHFDKKAIQAVKKETTKFYSSTNVGRLLEKVEIISDVKVPGEHVDIITDVISFDTIPAYNTTEANLKWHPKDRKDIGFILNFGKSRFLVPADTEPIPEYATPAFENLTAVILPINQPYTMTPEQAADAARTLKTPILYPSHGSVADFERTAELLKDDNIKVLIRKLE